MCTFSFGNCSLTRGAIEFICNFTVLSIYCNIPKNEFISTSRTNENIRPNSVIDFSFYWLARYRKLPLYINVVCLIHPRAFLFNLYSNFSCFFFKCFNIKLMIIIVRDECCFR